MHWMDGEKKDSRLVDHINGILNGRLARTSIMKAQFAHVNSGGNKNGKHC